MGYRSYNKVFHVDSSKTDNFQIYLSPNFNDTNAVVVQSFIPIRMNGDTLEINPAAFKMNPNAVVEELLNQVPGFTIWSDGTITLNGKKIPQILVDGKPFLGQSNATIATQNLPKTAIDKIQLYQEIDRTKQQREKGPQDSILTMNIKLKEDKKKGYFGKLSAGYGTRNRFESDLSFQMYDKKNSLGIGGGINNINRNINNLQEMFQNNTYRNFNPNLYNVGNFETNGINKNYSVGGVLAHSFIENSNSRQNDRITINYNFSGTNSYLTNLSLQERTTKDNPQFIEGNNICDKKNEQHTFGINYIKTNTYNDNFSITTNTELNNSTENSIQKTTVKDTSNQLQSTNNVNTYSKNSSDNTSLNINYSKYDQDNPLKRFYSTLNVNTNNSKSDRMVNSIFDSHTDQSADTAYNRLYKSDWENFRLGIFINYQGFKRLIFRRFNFFGIDVNLSQSLDYEKNKANNNVLDYDSVLKQYTPNNRISNNNILDRLSYSPTLGILKNFNKYGEGFYTYSSLFFNLKKEFKTEKNTSSVMARNIFRSFDFLTQQAGYNYYYDKQNNYNIRINSYYNRNFDYPSVDQLYTIIDDINVYDVRIGSPYLKNTTNNRINADVNFSKQKPKSNFGFVTSLNGGYNWYRNPIADSIVNDTSGRRSIYWVNVNKKKDFNFTYNAKISRKLKNNSIELGYRGSFSKSLSPNYIDALYSTVTNKNISHTINLQFALRSLLILNASENIETFQSKQSNSQLSSFKNNSNATKFGITLNYPKNAAISSTISYTNSANIPNPIVLWNAFGSYRFLKNQQGEIKFSAMDILKQFKNINNYTNYDGATTTITNGLQQYFLLTFSYFPRKFGKKELKQKQAQEVVY